jgi:hypothetical protein
MFRRVLPKPLYVESSWMMDLLVQDNQLKEEKGAMSIKGRESVEIRNN